MASRKSTSHPRSKPSSGSKAKAKSPPPKGRKPNPHARTPGHSPADAPAAQSTKPVINSAGQGAGAWQVQAGEVGIRVRMYRVGFGDFFLITFLEDNGSRIHVIVDCGVFKGTSQTGDIKSIEAAVADMVVTTDQEVALIIMTHRHADHIAGFARCEDKFAKLTVGGVWMPIWESEFDPTAAKFQAELTKTAMALQSHFSAAAAPSDEQDTARKFMENATGLDAAAATAGKSGAAGSNAVALNLLKKKLNGVTAAEYYQAGDTAKLPEALANIGVTAQILGPPPVADIDLMKLMDLKKGVGQYLADAALSGDEERAPFSAAWEVNPFAEQAADAGAGYPAETIKEWVQPRAWKGISAVDACAAQPLMEAALQSALPAASLTAAKQLNSFLNNQSLVVLFGYKGKKLLFVGDAQAGNWEHWLFETDKPDKLASGQMSVRAQDILSSIDFYKVGHHGSSNATPKIVAEALAQNTHGPACMCSTEKDVYGTEDPNDPSKGTEVPRTLLLDKLETTQAFVRSDQIDISFDAVVGPATRVEVPAKVSKTLPAAGPGRRFEPGPLWVDCFL